MAKEFAKAFYNSKAWKKCRKSYIEARMLIDGGMCEECGKEIGDMVHHKIILTPDNINDPQISLNHKYLKLDCKGCHDREEQHFVNAKPSRYYFDSKGMIHPK